MKKVGLIISKYEEYAELKIKKEIYGWRHCLRCFFFCFFLNNNQVGWGLGELINIMGGGI